MSRTEAQPHLRLGRVSVEDYGATPGGAVDASTGIQAALDSGARVVHGENKVFKVNLSITIPTDVVLEDIMLLAGTAGMNVLLVNSRSQARNFSIIGTGTVGVIERGVFPAAGGVVDVVLEDCDISQLTYGIHPAPTHRIACERWKITGRIHDIPEYTGRSGGYGVLLEGAKNCYVNVTYRNIHRHAMYLSAGAQFNNVYADVDTCGNAAINLFSTASQPETANNHIRGKVRGLFQGVAKQAVGVYCLQKVNQNDISVEIEGNNTTDHAVVNEGAPGGPYPSFNDIHDCHIKGEFIGREVVKFQNAESPRFHGNKIDAYSSNADSPRIIAVRRSGINGVKHAGHVFGNVVNAQGRSHRAAIYSEANAQPTFIDNNDVQNGVFTAGRVEDATGGRREGTNRKFSGTVTLSVAPGATRILNIKLPGPLENRPARKATATISNREKVAADVRATFVSTDALRVRVQNLQRNQLDLRISWHAEGD